MVLKVFKKMRKIIKVLNSIWQVIRIWKTQKISQKTSWQLENWEEVKYILTIFLLHLYYYVLSLSRASSMWWSYESYCEISWLLADEKFWLEQETKVLYDVLAEVGRHCWSKEEGWTWWVGFQDWSPPWCWIRFLQKVILIRFCFHRCPSHGQLSGGQSCCPCGWTSYDKLCRDMGSSVDV